LVPHLIPARRSHLHGLQITRASVAGLISQPQHSVLMAVFSLLMM